MKHSLFDTEHLKDYTFYGILAAIFFSITVWFFLYDADYTQTWVIYIGSAFFMFVIMLFLIKLYNQDDGKRSSESIVYAGHLAVLSGVIVSVVFCLLLTHNYRGDVLAGQHVSVYASRRNPRDLFTLFLPGIAVDFLAGSFVSFMIGYASKWGHQERNVAQDLY